MAGSTALLVIDVQVAMFDEGYLPHRATETRQVIAGLISRARQASVPVVFVQHEDADYEFMQPGRPGFEIHPDVAPIDGEPIIHKRASDSFAETPLAETLTALGIDNLVVTGLQTEFCIDTTCRSAISRGFDVTLVSDGHTTWDTDLLTAEQIIAHHNQHLAGIPHPHHGIATRPSDEIVF